jgi:hypothetical protein
MACRDRDFASALTGLPPSWHLLLEYPLLRLGRRVDAVLLTGHAVLVLEFTVGATSFTNVDRQQVEDYALDLFDFHAESRAYPIVPILVATDATPRATNWPLLLNKTPVLDASSSHEIKAAAFVPLDRRSKAPFSHSSAFCATTFHGASHRMST